MPLRACYTIALLALAGCGPNAAEVAARCDKVYTQGLINELLESRERRLGARDSTTPPPPTPKDLDWYDQHCYRGKAQ